jgi:hypothetical protein
MAASLSSRLVAWWTENLWRPMRGLSSTERAAAICLGLQTGMFPVPACTMVCLGFCLVLVKPLPIFCRIPPAVLGTISGAVNLLLAPIQLLAIPFYAALADSWGMAGFVSVLDHLDSTSAPNRLDLQGEINAYVGYFLRKCSAACLAWLATTIFILPLGFALTFVVGGRGRGAR